ncbi:hypothetical protein [Actinomadura sp. K4S16]|uniref:hypothetical protein n=1 Tax=Actinomadura sp. K4S16 TaxID=1316147 RepID=UPI0011F092E7|nr:hypothetical protein [Actinomadura sp. K4S16]
MPTISDFLYGALYQRQCRFANIERFIDQLEQVLDLTGSADADTAQRRIKAAAASLRGDAAIGSDAEAARELVARDLESLGTVDLSEIGRWETVTERLDDLAPRIQRRLADAGLAVTDAPLRVVEEFPEPFNRFTWSAFSPDREDEENFGIPTGVYFRRDRLRPLYSEALFAHEVIHTVTGQTDPEVFAMGLEEGIAEVLGTCYGSLAVLTEPVIRNLLVYGRHGAERDKLWSVYLDHTRQAFLLYREFGLDGLVELVRRGRAAIHDAEKRLMTGTHRDLGLPRGNWDEETTRLLEFSTLGFLPSHVFSPLECLLAINAEAGLTATEVCRRAGVDPDCGRPVLEGLGARSALFVQDGERIGYSNVERYLELEQASGVAVMRYLPPGG